MKKIFILSILFAMISCCECSKQPDTNIYHEVERTNDVYIVDEVHLRTVDGVHLRTVVIDSCEYLIGLGWNGNGNAGYMSHKGNCKYCAERRKRELENAK